MPGPDLHPWDGRGVPAGVRGEAIDVATRLVHLADVVEVHHRRDGVAAALDVAHRLSGTTLDPAVVAAFGLPAESSWSELIAADPAPRTLSGPALDAGLEALADFVDLKSPWFAGHSRGVADLAAASARHIGLPPTATVELRHAGLVHDLGRAGVPNTILDKPGQLTGLERESAAASRRAVPGIAVTGGPAAGRGTRRGPGPGRGGARQRGAPDPARGRRAGGSHDP